MAERATTAPGEWVTDRVTADPDGWAVWHLHHSSNGRRAVCLVGPDGRNRHWEVIR